MSGRALQQAIESLLRTTDRGALAPADPRPALPGARTIATPWYVPGEDDEEIEWGLCDRVPGWIAYLTSPAAQYGYDAETGQPLTVINYDCEANPIRIRSGAAWEPGHRSQGWARAYSPEADDWVSWGLRVAKGDDCDLGGDGDVWLSCQRMQFGSAVMAAQYLRLGGALYLRAVTAFGAGSAKVVTRALTGQQSEIIISGLNIGESGGYLVHAALSADGTRVVLTVAMDAWATASEQYNERAVWLADIGQALSGSVTPTLLEEHGAEVGSFSWDGSSLDATGFYRRPICGAFGPAGDPVVWRAKVTWQYKRSWPDPPTGVTDDDQVGDMVGGGQIAWVLAHANSSERRYLGYLSLATEVGQARAIGTLEIERDDHVVLGPLDLYRYEWNQASASAYGSVYAADLVYNGVTTGWGTPGQQDGENVVIGACHSDWDFEWWWDYCTGGVEGSFDGEMMSRRSYIDHGHIHRNVVGVMQLGELRRVFAKDANGIRFSRLEGDPEATVLVRRDDSVEGEHTYERDCGALGVSDEFWLGKIEDQSAWEEFLAANSLVLRRDWAKWGVVVLHHSSGDVIHSARVTGTGTDSLGNPRESDGWIAVGAALLDGGGIGVSDVTAAGAVRWGLAET